MSDVALKEAPKTGAPLEPRRRFRIGEFGWVWIGLIGLFILSALIAPGTLDIDNLRAIMPFFAILALAAVGQTLVIQQRGLDFSIPGTIALVAIVMTKIETAGNPLWYSLLVAGLLAALIGIVNSLIIVFLSITPLVATLATNAILIGAAFGISKGAYATTSDDWNEIARGEVIGIPIIVIIAVVIIAGLSFVLRKTVSGRRFIVVGANPSAARAAGVRVRRYQMSAYIVCSLCAGLAGVLLAGYVGAATPQLGDTYLLATIAAVVIGGTPFTGGRGSLVATAVGALFLSQLAQLTLALGAPASTQLFVQAGVLVLAVALRNLDLAAVGRALRGRSPEPADAATTVVDSGERSP
jgi:ribose transport system permease protein